MPEKNMPIETMNYETAFNALQQIVGQLESQELTLDESLQLFEKGRSLAKHCTELLEQAELKVQNLTEDATFAAQTPED